MPETDPGSLPEQDYVDILAYILSLNRYPAGDSVLQYEDGTLDFTKVTVEDWMHVSFLSLFEGNVVEFDRTVEFRGGVYTLHACIDSITPPEQTETLRGQIQ